MLDAPRLSVIAAGGEIEVLLPLLPHPAIKPRAASNIKPVQQACARIAIIRKFHMAICR
jgi:hypothetical protein